MIVKTCKKHGPLTHAQIKIETKSNGKQIVRCNLCQREAYARYRLKHIDKIKANAAKKSPQLIKQTHERFIAKHGRDYVNKKANEYYHAHREKLLEQNRGYYAKNSDKESARKKEYYVNNKELYRLREKKYCAQMSDKYIKRLLADNSKQLKPTDFNQMPTLIELKRLTLTIKRKLKDEQHRGT